MKRAAYRLLSDLAVTVAVVAAVGPVRVTAMTGVPTRIPWPRQSAASSAGTGGKAHPSAAGQAARFSKTGDGTVTDNRTGLVWLEDASCADLPRTDGAGRAYGATAVLAAGDLADPACGLSDGSRAGDWRLPDRAELESLLDLAFHDPALSNGVGTAKWAPDDPFSGVESTYYWSSTTLASDPTYVWCVDLWDGIVFYAYEVNYYYVWPVRGVR